MKPVYNNIVSNYGTCIMLNGPNGASIDADQGGLGDAWDNVWNPHASLSNLKVDGAVLGSFQINWFHQLADNSGNSWSPRLWYGNIIDPRPNEASGSVTCDDFSRYAVNRVANFGSIVGDSANYGTDSIATRYQARLEAYLAMKNDTTIIYLFDSLDAHFENFYLTLDSGNVGRFCRVVEMAATDTDSAAILNSAITASGETETMLKSFNTLYFDKILAGDTLNSSDSTNLEYMALLSRSAYGAMVHNAAAALFLEIHPEEAFLRQGYFSITSNLSQTVIADKPQLIIYPNPANNKLTVESNNNINHLQIFNSMGREIIRLKCNANKVELELQDLPSGIYLIRAVNGSDIISNKIFTVIK